MGVLWFGVVLLGWSRRNDMEVVIQHVVSIPRSQVLRPAIFTAPDSGLSKEKNLGIMQAIRDGMLCLI